MEISLFDAIGPVMIGPSSSHTAGAAKLGRIAAQIVGEEFKKVTFGLHGSFAKTYKGHGTDVALVAGVMGIKEDSLELKNAFTIAKEKGINYSFYTTDLGDVHENSVKIVFRLNNNSIREIIGSSIGGGRIVIYSVDGLKTNIALTSSTLVITQKDVKGAIYHITQVIAEKNINIGKMTVTREAKDQTACCVIETDSYISNDIVNVLRKQPYVYSVHAFNI